MADISVAAASPAAVERARADSPVVGISAFLLLAGTLVLGHAFGWRQGALYLLGGGLGFALYHAAFGFTSAFRVLIADGRGAGLRAQMVMLALAALLFFPALGHGSLLGHPVNGEAGPLGPPLLVGAFLFGVGMQLAGGCASGTLYTIGGGSTRMLVTLAFFIAGSALGAADLPNWQAMPTLPKVSLIESFGWLPALSLSLALFAAIAWISATIERRRHGRIEPIAHRAGWREVLRGPWPLVWGAVALAIGNILTLALAGRPWGVTSGFALWGSKLWALTGADVASWAYWAPPARAKALHESVFADITSVMDFGIVLGALLAAGLAGRFAPVWRVPWRSLAAAAIGGVLLGYGARLAYGCNIGAYFSGIVSSSLHGWVWLAMALAGTAAVVRPRDRTIEIARGSADRHEIVDSDALHDHEFARAAVLAVDVMRGVRRHRTALPRRQHIFVSGRARLDHHRAFEADHLVGDLAVVVPRDRLARCQGQHRHPQIGAFGDGFAARDRVVAARSTLHGVILDVRACC